MRMHIYRYIYIHIFTYVHIHVYVNIQTERVTNDNVIYAIINTDHTNNRKNVNTPLPADKK